MAAVFALTDRNGRMWPYFSKSDKSKYVSAKDVLSGVVAGVSYQIVLDLTNNHIYWVETGSEKIRRAKLDGTGVEDLITPADTDAIFYDIALDVPNNHMYLVAWYRKKLARANLDGSEIQTLRTDVTRGVAISLEFSSTTYSQEIRYVPFNSKYILFVLMAVLGGWLVLRQS